MTLEPSPLLKPVLKAFSKSLKSEDVTVQSTGATALSKLMLGQLITDGDLLKQLVITFFDPETSANAQLRQALSYFLPVYCHSRQENAERMVQASTGVIAKLSTLREAFVDDADMDEGEMVTLAVIGGLLVDWTDPRKIIGAREEAMANGSSKPDRSDEKHEGCTHLMLGEQILECLVTAQSSSKSIGHI
jgi:condensin complex subunit 3